MLRSGMMEFGIVTHVRECEMYFKGQPRPNPHAVGPQC